MAKKQLISSFESFVNECDCAGELIKKNIKPLGEGEEEGEEEGGEGEGEETHKKGAVKITINAYDSEGSLAKLIHAIQDAGNGGHSFSIVVDPDGDEPISIGWDGDGSDKIHSIEVDADEESDDDEDGDDEGTEDVSDTEIDGEGDDEYGDDEDEDEGYTFEAFKAKMKKKDKKSKVDKNNEKDFSRISDKSIDKKPKVDKKVKDEVVPKKKK